MICYSPKAPCIPIIVPEMGFFKKKSHLKRKCSLLLMGGFLTLSLFSGCAKQVRPTPSPIQKDASIEELLSLYQKRLKGTGSFKALMEVTAHFGDHGRHTFRASLHFQNDQSRIRGFDLFGGTLFDLRLNDRFFSLKVPSEKAPLEAELEQFELVAGEKIPFGSLDLLEWVQRGGIPEPALRDIPALEKGKDFFILYLFSMERGMARLRQKISIERTAFRVKRVELFERSGVRRGMLTFDNYRKLDGRDFPFFVKGAGGGEEIAMTFREVSFGLPDLDDPQ